MHKILKIFLKYSYCAQNIKPRYLEIVNYRIYRKGKNSTKFYFCSIEFFIETHQVKSPLLDSVLTVVMDECNNRNYKQPNLLLSKIHDELRHYSLNKTKNERKKVKL